MTNAHRNMLSGFGLACALWIGLILLVIVVHLDEINHMQELTKLFYRYMGRLRLKLRVPSQEYIDKGESLVDISKALSLLSGIKIIRIPSNQERFLDVLSLTPNLKYSDSRILSLPINTISIPISKMYCRFTITETFVYTTNYWEDVQKMFGAKLDNICRAGNYDAIYIGDSTMLKNEIRFYSWNLRDIGKYCLCKIWERKYIPNCSITNFEYTFVFRAGFLNSKAEKYGYARDNKRRIH